MGRQTTACNQNRTQARLVTPGGPVERADFSVNLVVVFDLGRHSWIRVLRGSAVRRRTTRKKSRGKYRDTDQQQVREARRLEHEPISLTDRARQAMTEVLVRGVHYLITSCSILL
jgi:hypothetical protein